MHVEKVSVTKVEEEGWVTGGVAVGNRDIPDMTGFTSQWL